MGFYEDKTKKNIKNHFLGVLGLKKKNAKKTKTRCVSIQYMSEGTIKPRDGTGFFWFFLRFFLKKNQAPQENGFLWFFLFYLHKTP